MSSPGKRQGTEATEGSSVTRRTLLASAGGAALAARSLATGTEPSQRDRPGMPVAPIRIQPVLTYSVPRRQEATSWRSWGGIQTEAQASAEIARINAELTRMAGNAEFPIEALPARAVKDRAQAAQVAASPYDVLIIFAAGGWADLFQTMSRTDRWNLMFLRHSPGPVYLWYEIAHPHFLRKAVDDYGEPGWSPDDVIVDNYDRLAQRLRALHGLKQALGKLGVGWTNVTRQAA